MNTLFLEPLDVLYLRGNKLFGDAGSHGEALMPPWPSLAAGALRSRLLAEGQTLDSMADFRLTGFSVARRRPGGSIETLWPLPADLMVSADALDDASYLYPTTLAEGIASSYPLTCLPAFCADQPAKPVSGLWLTGEGIAAWLLGSKIEASHLLRAEALWKTDARLGIALDPQRRSAADSMIYTTETVAMRRDVGFLVGYTGAAALPDATLLRLGGDGRGASVSKTLAAAPQPDWERIAAEKRFRLILTTPGLFADGWHPAPLPATLVAAVASRNETISGWDLLSRRPKPAQRVVPTGSVYWYDKLADLAALRALVDNGLPIIDAARCAEGFNQCGIAPWPKEN